LCGKCIFTCQERGKNIIGFAHRGFKRIVTAFADEPRGPLCEDCFECVSICPVGALVLKEKK
jgi:NADH dehydrogenase/NADH:ubiquinone oxidoreductase subunit G